MLEDKVKEIIGDDSTDLEQESSDGFLSQELDAEDELYDDVEKFSPGGEAVEYRPKVYFHSSERMKELEDESVHFAITSPPYNTGWNYGDYEDEKDYYNEYMVMLADVFSEVYRVLTPGARFAINVPSLLRDGATGGYPIASDITQMMITPGDAVVGLRGDSDYLDAVGKMKRETDWVMREQIAWVKPFNNDGLAPNGSFPRPGGILLNNMHEVVMVFQKPGKRDYSDMSDERIEDSKINKTEQDMTDDVWRIEPDSWSPRHAEGEDIPVFPDKLVRRAMRLWSYKDDVVLDPFAGRFTTGKVAKEEERYSVGYELRESLKDDIKAYTGQEQTGLTSY